MRSFHPILFFFFRHLYFSFLFIKSKSSFQLNFYLTLIGHIVVLDLPGGFHDSFRQRANIHNRGVLLVLGADKKCGDATRIIIIGNLRFRIRQDQCKLFIRINFFVFLIVFNVFSDSID